ncbi:CFEM domain-containing protein [Hirsutella rhossiliensis]|uniref:CFEM domain-containing protein n=1 Tax=Hirsutella rhossiliensis TaxID=111463 RepID=A0A9P8N0L3_9HYPO|nr:CFEM domain-containing protein [Hirsutella rhossiliensis]KAH0964705.1 CFEM domain-containing protein [Hirsutella rhossiliensis]
MKFSAVAALAVAALANAQSLSDIPSCARPCIDNAVKENTQCSTTDIPCVCKNFDAVQGPATSCVLKACGQDVALTKVLPATQALCKNAGSGGSQSSASPSAPASASPSAPASQQPSSAQPSQPAQSSEPAEPSETDEPSQPAETSGSAQPTQPGQQTTKCDTTLVPTAAPTAPSNGTVPTAPIVTAGAAGVVPAGGLAILALGAFLL